MLHALLDAVLTLLKYFGLLAGVSLAAVLSITGSFSAWSNYRADQERRQASARSFRAWADVAFPPVEWDRRGQRYLTEAERAKLRARANVDQPVAVPQGPPSPAPVPPILLSGPPPLPSRRKRKYGFERRY
jgi:hypothetical protein